MSLWNGAWYLAKRDLLDKSVFLCGIFYCGLIILFTFDYVSMNLFAVEQKNHSITIFQNMVVVLLFQNLGYRLDHKYFTKYYKTDVFTKRYSFLSTLPITIKQMILARYMQYTITLAVMYAVIFGITGIWGNIIHSGNLTAVQFIEFMLMWVGYTILFGSINILLELGFHGKIHYWFNIAVYFIFVAGCFCLSFISVWQVAIDLIVSYGYLIPCASLLLAGLVTWLVIKQLARRMQTRDLYI
ncbi:hypothetical protein E0485_09985 [Paenibacillus albiflavus]|uniref:ABC-2 transporter permease n=1 Tax=Paenibacillus albiflavus TaxID=2545760 RepID=A0A4R4EHY6_9BACL|nr:ABC-2 transporter permease [Paenibacillus albiflavus]TCZ77795.1 hypothetical protein E0485_09985 [Paenibacillus albiflavus]